MPPEVERAAYSYIRFSTPGQLEGDSLRRQEAAAEAYAARNGLTLDSTLRDLGRSAYAGDHRKGAMGAFLEAIKAGAVKPDSIVLVEAIDRLSREFVIDAMAMLGTIINHGITVVTLEDEQEYSRRTLQDKPYLLQMLLAKMTQANSESKRKSDLVGAAWRNKKKLAKTEKKPIGKTCPAWLKLSSDGKTYELIEDRAAIIARIFAETIGGIGKDKIARRLNAEKIPTFSGASNGWHPSYIAKILSNRAVIGEFQPHFKNTATEKRQTPDGEPVSDYYPAVISVTDWNASRAATASRRGLGGRKGIRIANLVSGICRCDICGGTMVLINGGERHKSAVNRRVPDGQRSSEYLVCDNARRANGCSETTRIRYHGIERALLAGVLLLDEARGILPPAPITEDETSKRMSILADDVAQDKRRLKDLTTTFTDLAPLQDSIRFLMDRIAAKETEHNAIAKEKIETITVGGDFWTVASEVVAKAGDGDFSTRARLQSVMRTVFQEIYCNAKSRTAYAFALGGRAGIAVSQDGAIRWIDVFHRNPDRTFRVDASGNHLAVIPGVPTDGHQN